MASGDAFSIGTTGLRAFQRSLATTSHNIANVDTPGFARQSVEVGSNPSFGFGALSRGTGVRVFSVERQFDQFLQNELILRNAEFSAASARESIADRVTEMIGNNEVGLSEAMQQLLPALEGAAANPASAARRGEAMAALSNLMNRLGALSGAVNDLRDETISRIQTGVSAVNDITAELAELNQRIRSTGGGSDILDRRDRLLEVLSGQVAITTVAQDDGSINIFLGGVQPLVIDTSASTLSLRPGEPPRLTLQRGASETDATAALQGGELGGSYAAVLDELEVARTGLDRIAVALASEINGAQQLGLDLDGNAGAALLTDINAAVAQASRVVGDTANAGNAAIALTIDDPRALPSTPLRLLRDNNSWVLLDRAGTLVDSFTTLPRSLPALGFTLSQTGGTPQNGDSYAVRPAAGAAGNISVLSDEPRALALATPVDSTTDIGNGGNLTVTELRVTELDAGEVATNFLGPREFVYDAATTTFVSTAPSALTLPYDPASASGTTTQLAIGGYGTVAMRLEGAPQDGDRFTLSLRTTGSGDNRNADALTRGISSKLLDNGSRSIADTPGHLVGELGRSLQSQRYDREASAALLERARSGIESHSGVNLDEEAANLLRFQQAYEASARVVAVSGQMFQTLLSAVSS